jgi:hypothetical protein
MRSNDILRKQKLKEAAEKQTTESSNSNGDEAPKAQTVPGPPVTELRHEQLYDPSQKVRLSAEQCVKIILEAADRRARKVRDSLFFLPLVINSCFLF